MGIITGIDAEDCMTVLNKLYFCNIPHLFWKVQTFYIRIQKICPASSI